MELFTLLALSSLLSLGSAIVAIVAQKLVDSRPLISEKSQPRSGPEITWQRYIIYYIQIAGILVYILPRIRWRQDEFWVGSFWEEITRFILMMLLADFTNYAWHRAMHESKLLYRITHYEHHLETNPRSFDDSTLTHWIEWIATAFVELYPVLFWEQTLFSFVFFGFWLPVQVQLNHCGRILPKIPLLISPTEHHAHHKYRNVNFAEHTIIPDYIFGTYMHHDGV